MACASWWFENCRRDGVVGMALDGEYLELKGLTPVDEGVASEEDGLLSLKDTPGVNGDGIGVPREYCCAYFGDWVET